MNSLLQVSVVLPVRDAECSIERAVRSILNQTLSAIELIIINDGSTDETMRVVRSISDPRIRVLETERRGVAEAANFGTELARAPLIARMDADDFAYPDRLAQQATLLQQEQLDVVGGRVSIVDRAGMTVASMQRYQRWINDETSSHQEILALRFVEFPLVNPTILAKRSYFELKYRSNEYPEDYELMLRAAAKGLRFGKVPNVLLDWTDHQQRITRTHAHYTASAFMACRRRYLLEGPLLNATRVDVWGVGKTGKQWLRWLTDEGVIVRRAYDASVRRIGETIHGTRVCDPKLATRSDGTPMLIAVGTEGARQHILPQIRSLGYVSGRDAWFVA